MVFRLYPLVLTFITILLLPFLGILWLTLLLCNLVCALTAFTAKEAPDESKPVSGSASIIILNWNGRNLLEQGLPSIIKAVETDGRSHEILVVDNGSSDNSVEYVESPRNGRHDQITCPAANRGRPPEPG